MDEKTCPRCQEKKPYSEFHKNAAQRDGYSPYCKPCKKATHKPSEASQERARERARNRLRRLREADPTFNAQSCSAYYYRHREKRQAKQREYRANNPEKVRESNVKYRLTNYEAVRARENAKNARRYAAEGTHTAADILEKLINQQRLCYWRKEALSEKYHVDHVIPLARGGSNWPDNIVISCAPCNQRKGCKMPDEWMAVLSEDNK